MIDVITVWPDHCDYPVFRKMISDTRREFDEVIVAFTAANTMIDRTSFVMSAMQADDVTFIKKQSASGDWRNNATNEALSQSRAEWVLFIEQDFLIHKPAQFFYNLKKQMADYDVIGFKEGERLHPGFLLIKRKLLNETCLDFSVVPNKYDHFYLITRDIVRLGFKTALLDDIGLERRKTYFHMNGLSHNLTLLQNGDRVTFEPDMFLSYLRSCAQSKIELPIDFFPLYDAMKAQRK